MPRTGAPIVGVTSSSQLEEIEGAPAHAWLAIEVTPAGSGLAMRTAKSRETEAPASEPTASVQVEPAPEVGVQVHPGEELAETKLVWSGTFSVKATEEAA